jgi:branched-chain amino acid transport system permease protein
MVISGGAGTLLGPVVGAALVVIVKNVVSGVRFDVSGPMDFANVAKFILNGLFQHWNFLLGAIFVLIVIFMPEGLVPGTVRLVRGAWRAGNRRKPAAARPTAAEPKP